MNGGSGGSASVGPSGSSTSNNVGIDLGLGFGYPAQAPALTPLNTSHAGPGSTASGSGPTSGSMTGISSVMSPVGGGPQPFTFPAANHVAPPTPTSVATAPLPFAFPRPRPSMEGSQTGSTASRPPRDPVFLQQQAQRPPQLPQPQIQPQFPQFQQQIPNLSTQQRLQHQQHLSRHSRQLSAIGLPDPQTPSEYALNVLMSRFISLANERLANTMNKSVDAEPLIAAYLSSRVDGVLEKLIASLGQIARKHARAVVESLIRWRTNTLDAEEMAMLGRRRDDMAGFSFPTQGSGNGPRASSFSRPAPNHLRRRKAHVCTYLLTHALEGVARTLANSSTGSRIPLSERDANVFESFAFDTLQVCCRELGANAVMDSNNSQHPTSLHGHHTDPLLGLCFESASALLGELSKMRFMSVADRFVSAIENFKKAGAPKEGELQMENLMLGARNLHITVFPMELFEEGAEFVDTLSKFFVSSAVNSSARLRIALTDTFVHLMLPVAGLASAEINHPAWTKAVDTIWPRALQMASKPKYWSYAYPLHATLMAVSPGERFLAHWTSCIDAGTSKLKDRGARIPVLHAAVKLLWVYLNRCHESSSTTLRRLESFFRIWFPPNRKLVVASDMSIEMHTQMVHIVLFRQFEFGRNLVLDFLRDPVLNDGRPLALNPDLLSPVRMSIAIGAIVRALDCHVKQEPAPFPSGRSFFVIDEYTPPKSNKKDGSSANNASASLGGTTSAALASLGDDLPTDFSYPRKELEEAQNKFNTLISKIALICDAAVGDLSVFDDRVNVLKGAALTTGNVAGERSQLEREGNVVQAHSPLKLTVAYGPEHQPILDLLRSCIDSWPRCLSPAIQLQSVLSILQRALVSADPKLARSASATLTRIGTQRTGTPFLIVSNFMRWLFRPQVMLWEVAANQTLLFPKVETVLKAWIASLELWLQHMAAATAAARAGGEAEAAIKGMEMERISAYTVLDEIEANALFLLCSAWRPFRVLGTKVLQLVASLDEAIERGSRVAKGLTPVASPNPQAAGTFSAPAKVPSTDEATRIIVLLQRPFSEFCDVDSALLDEVQKERLVKLKDAVQPESLEHLLQSEDPINSSIWTHILPGMLRQCLRRFPTTIAMFRTALTSRILAMDGNVTFAIGWGSGRAPSTPSTSRAPVVPLSGTDRDLLAKHWSSYVLALCTTTSASEASRGHDMSVDSGPIGRTSSTAERVISARDLFYKLEPFLASEWPAFREGAVAGLGNINADLYTILLESMHSISARINDEFRGRGPSKSGSKRNRRNERLRAGVGQILHLTSPNLMKASFLSEQKVVQTILAWVQSTFLFLTDRDIRDDWSFQSLRRFFAGVVEAFFDGLSKMGNTERYFTFDSRFRMFQIFREWHSYSEQSDDGPAKLANILASAAEQQRDDWTRKQAVTTLLAETQALSYQAACTMAALCQGAVSLVGSAVPAPMSGTALDASSLLTWLSRMFNSASKQSHAVAKRALRGLLLHNSSHHELVSLVIDCAVSESDSMGVDKSFFAVLTEALLLRSHFLIPTSQAACLAFIKLGHTDRQIRELALQLLYLVLPTVTDEEYAEVAVGSLSHMTALHQKAQINLVVLTCKRKRSLEPAFAAELALRLPSMPESKRQACLQLLPHVLKNVDLLKGVDGSSLTPFVTGFLSNLSFITTRFGDRFQTEIDDMWTALVTGEAMLTNADAINKFFVEQSLKTRSEGFITIAKKVLACLFALDIGHYLFDEICKLIEPTSMIPIPRERGATPADLLDFYVADLHGEVSSTGNGRNLVFSVGQVALMFVGELHQGRSAQLKRHLPVLLHAAVTQVDCQFECIRLQAISILDQLVRSLAPPKTLFTSLATKQEESPRWWTMSADVDDGDDRVPDTMRPRIEAILTALLDFTPELREHWGSVAHFWATQGPVRHLAIRSLQIFRILMPSVTPRMLVDMLARLSNTVSDPDEDIQIFTLELLYTVRSIVKATSERETDLLAHVYWATVACLSTSVESEFLAATRLLAALMDKLDLRQKETQDMLMRKRPEDWEGEPATVQKLLMRGLRSSATYETALQVLSRTTRLHHNTIIDTSEGRLAYVFAAAMPFFMNKMEHPTADHAIAEQLALDVASLADFSGKKDISRICDSVIKNRFRTKEDLTRQGVMCLRSNYLPKLGPDLAILMIGLCLNNTLWLRKQTLRLIKVFFQNINTQDVSFSKLGLELLMPILQLLSTPLAAEALDVLEEPLAINGGLASQQVLRMSLQWGKMDHANNNDHALDTAIFGAPQESGWAVARPQDASLRTRINIQAVFKQTELTLDLPLLSSNVNFVTDDYYDGDQDGSFVQEDGSLNNDRADSISVNELVNQLHDLSTFFVDETSAPANAFSPTTVSSKGAAWRSNTSRNGTGTAGSRSLSETASQWASFSERNGSGTNGTGSSSIVLPSSAPNHQSGFPAGVTRTPRPPAHGSIEKVARIVAQSAHSKQHSQVSDGQGSKGYNSPLISAAPPQLYETGASPNQTYIQPVGGQQPQQRYYQHHQQWSQDAHQENMIGVNISSSDSYAM
ncbi:Cell morphogenesis protein PAG1 [Tilletia horrida]|nr:Cell morphogenesis protein PAG1 [Tilletia horrida]